MPPDDGRVELRPKILLLTVDTLRADALGSYGGSAQTPMLDRLASRALLFENAVAPMPSTRPSHFTLLTGRHPRRHGALSNADSLAEELQTLPMILLDAGYETSGFTGVKLLAPGSGAERGFEHFDAPQSGYRVAGEVVDSALRWLQPRLTNPSARPWFLWTHVYDPHMPYGPPEPQDTPPPHQLPADTSAFSRSLVSSILATGDGDLPAWLFDYARRRYHEEVEYVDRQLGRLLDAIAHAEAGGETLILFTADHGECFGNGYYFEHGRCLYEASIRIPMLLDYPPSATAGERVSVPVRLSEVLATILRILGLTLPDGAVASTLFEPDPGPLFVQRPVYGETAANRRRSRLPEMRSVMGRPVARDDSAWSIAVRTARWKLLWDGTEPLLYDLEEDPSEERNLAAEHPDTVRELRKQLERWQLSNPLVVPDAVLDPEHEATLRSLGYL